MVQPGQWIARAIEFQEFEFVGGGEEITAGIVFIVSPVAAPCSVPRLLHLLLHALQHEVQHDLLLALIVDCGFQCDHRLRDELHRPHNLFDGLKAVNNVAKGDAVVTGPRPTPDCRRSTHGGG
jgi:hypothetical protein